jgi:damage-control phosphatase, subfamily III
LGDGEKGKLAAFWTTPYPYWELNSKDEALGKVLGESGLVIFKGDLKYASSFFSTYAEGILTICSFRKLTGDIAWPAHTPPQEAFGRLAGSFPILSLRTNKADVVVGVPKDVGEKLDKEQGIKWRVNGK